MDKQGKARRRALKSRLVFTAVALALSLVWFAITTGMVAQETRAVREASASQRQLSDLRSALQQLSIELNHAETGQRGYLLTHSDRYLGPYLSARQAVPTLLHSIDAIAAIAPDEAATVSLIGRTAEFKMTELAQTVRLENDGNHAAAMAMLKTDQGQEVMEQLRGNIANLDAHLLASERSMRDRTAAGVAHRESLVMLAGCAVVLLVLVAGFQTVTLFQEQRRFEATLSASEQRHRALIEEQTELIALVSADGTLDYCNPALRQFFALDETQSRTWNLLNGMAGGDRRVMKLHLGLALAAPDPIAAETRVTSGAGLERWVSWRMLPRTTEGGLPAVYLVGRDVTNRRNAEMQLKASQDFLARTGRVAGVGGWELDLASGKITWSSQIRRIYEVDDDFVPTLENTLSFFTPEGVAKVTQAMHDARVRGTPYDLELPMVPSSGHMVYVRAVGEIEYDEKGVPARLVGTLQDVSDRKRLELRLEASERFVRGITDNIQVRIAYFDNEGRFKFVNRALVERYGVQREMLEGKDALEVLQDPARSKFKQALLSAARGASERFEYDDVTEDGTQRIEVRVTPDIVKGEVRGAFAVGVDISHLKEIERALSERTEVFDNTSDFVAQSDWRGKLRFMNRSARRMVGLGELTSLDGLTYAKFFSPASNEQYARDILPTVKQNGIWVGESVILDKQGREVPVSHMVIAHKDPEGRISRYTSLMRDISQEVVARNELARQTATLNAIVDSMPSPVAVWDQELKYRLVNRAFEEWWGMERDQFIGRTVMDAAGAEEYEHSLPWMNKTLGGKSVTYEREYPHARHMRVASVSYTPLTLPDGSIAGLMGITQDITKHREEAHRLMLLTEKDPLTALLNRTGFEHYMLSKVEAGEGPTLAVIYIDLDHFKPINDRFGHAAGDAVLVEFATRLQRLVRPTDAVARLGGDEFAVVLAGVRERSAALRVAEKIVEIARQPHTVNGEAMTIGASVGVALDAEARGGWKELLACADAFAYQAKAQGRGRVVIQAETEQPTAARLREQG